MLGERTRSDRLLRKEELVATARRAEDRVLLKLSVREAEALMALIEEEDLDYAELHDIHAALEEVL